MTGGYQAHLLNITTVNAEKARKEAEELARKNAPVDQVLLWALVMTVARC